MTNTTTTTLNIELKPSKATIVERLLTDKTITPAEAVILLMEDNRGGITYVPYTPPFQSPGQAPWYPSYPIIY